MGRTVVNKATGDPCLFCYTANATTQQRQIHAVRSISKTIDVQSRRILFRVGWLRSDRNAARPNGRRRRSGLHWLSRLPFMSPRPERITRTPRARPSPHRHHWFGTSFPQTELGDGTPNPHRICNGPDISWVIGGYSTAANFVDNDGFILTDDATSKPVTSSVGRIHAANSTGFGLATDDFGGTPLAYDCFRCHVTGGESLADNGGRRQENRPGVGGTWAEAGVQCEACHGPGSVHVASPQTVGLEVDGSATACAECHAREVGTDTTRSSTALLHRINRRRSCERARMRTSVARSAMIPMPQRFINGIEGFATGAMYATRKRTWPAIWARFSCKATMSNE